MSSNQDSSMRALLESLTADAEKVSSEKQSADDIKQAPAQPLDPGTAATELAEDTSKNISVQQGERAAENDAYIADHLGAQAAVDSPGPIAASDDIPQVAPAANVAKATEDPESQARSASAPVAEVEPGTAAPELKLSVDAWNKQAAELLVDLAVDVKVAEEKGDRPEAGEEAEAPTPEAKVEEEGEGNKEVDPGTSQKEADLCDYLAGNDKAAADQLRNLVHDQLVEASVYGEKLAANTVSFLEVLQEEKAAAEELAEEEVAAEPAPVEDAPVADAMPMEGAPMEEAGMEEAGMEEALAEDPAVIEEALTELAAEMGVAPEELGQLLAGGMEGEAPVDPMMGAEAAPAMDEGSMAAEAALEGKAASEQVAFGLKYAAAKSAVKKDALELLAETVARGRR